VGRKKNVNQIKKSRKKERKKENWLACSLKVQIVVLLSMTISCEPGNRKRMLFF